MIELHQVAQRAKDLRLLVEQAAPSALIYLRVPDVRESITQLREANVTVETEPHRVYVDTDGAFGEKGFGEWMAFIRDSEDNLVGPTSRHAATS